MTNLDIIAIVFWLVCLGLLCAMRKENDE